MDVVLSELVLQPCDFILQVYDESSFDKFSFGLIPVFADLVGSLAVRASGKAGIALALAL